tara:strand:- start:1805 stop:2122 length:318 start_codon:yes stop_codon:yes gene_type:complete
MHHEGADTAWPECFQCSYRGSDKYKKHMLIENVEEEFLSKDATKTQELMDFAKDLWNEIIGMEKLESDPDYFGDGLADEDELFAPWYDIPTEELLLEEETDNNKE